MIDSEGETPFPVAKQRDADEGSNLQGGEPGRQGAGVGGGIANDDDFAPLRGGNEFLVHKIREAVGGGKVGGILAVPFVDEGEFFGSPILQLEEGADSQIQMSTDLRAGDSHHLPDVGGPDEVEADVGEQRVGDFLLLVGSDIPGNGEQLVDPSVRIRDAGNLDVPPFRLGL